MTLESSCPGEPATERSEAAQMRVLAVLSPSKTSHEIDIVRAMPAATVDVITGVGFPPADAQHHLPTFRVPYLGSPQRWTAALAWHRGLHALELNDPDVVVSFELHAPASMQAAHLAQQMGVPHVVGMWETLDDLPIYRVPPWSRYRRHLVHSATRFVCFTERARRHAVALGCSPRRCAVVSPGVDLVEFAPSPNGLQRKPVALFLGELRVDKGVRDVIAASELVAAELPDFKLMIAGDGKLVGEVRAAAARLPFVEYLGRLPRHSIPELLVKARALVVAPRRRRLWEEQFGFVFAEAMAAGLPIAATRCGAIPEVIAPMNPLTAQGDPEGLAVAMAEALGPRAEAIGAANRAWTEAHFALAQQGQAFRGELELAISRFADSRATPLNVGADE